jgi:hypothetical protein
MVGHCSPSAFGVDADWQRSALPERLVHGRVSMMLALARFAIAVSLVASATVSCTSDSSKAPANEGTLIVRATMTLGPVDMRTGRAAVEYAMAKTDIRVHASGGAMVLSKTDKHGDARFRLAPGVYVARLAHTVHDDWNGDELLCHVGDAPATARVVPHRVTRVEVKCVQP